MNTQKIDALIHSVYQKNEYPVSLYQAQKWKEVLPLAGLTILDATPVFRNTLVKHQALIAAGANLIIGISDVMPRDEMIVELLRISGFEVKHPEDTVPKVDIVLDCAAAFNTWQPQIGFVELTRSGVEKFGNTNKPVFVADNGHIKRIETCLGTGESYCRAM